MRKGDRSVTIIATGDILLHSEQSIKCECSTPGLTPLTNCMHQTLSEAQCVRTSALYWSIGIKTNWVFPAKKHVQLPSGVHFCSFSNAHVLLFHLPICVHVSQFWGQVDFAETTEPKTEMEKGIETRKEVTSYKGYIGIFNEPHQWASSIIILFSSVIYASTKAGVFVCCSN